MGWSVDQPLTVLHLATADHASTAQVDAWLQRYSTSVSRCSDVFDACLNLIRSPEHVPDLVLLGADYLLTDELNIFDYLRETWPSAIVVVYGDAERCARLTAGRDTDVYTPPRAALDLAQSPAALLEQARQALRGGESARLKVRPTEVAVDPTPQANGIRLRSGESSAILTREELAALLGRPPGN